MRQEVNFETNNPSLLKRSAGDQYIQPHCETYKTNFHAQGNSYKDYPWKVKNDTLSLSRRIAVSAFLHKKFKISGGLDFL